jgi:hypothetical protein
MFAAFALRAGFAAFAGRPNGANLAALAAQANRSLFTRKTGQTALPLGAGWAGWTDVATFALQAMFTALAALANDAFSRLAARTLRTGNTSRARLTVLDSGRAVAQLVERRCTPFGNFGAQLGNDQPRVRVHQVEVALPLAAKLGDDLRAGFLQRLAKQSGISIAPIAGAFLERVLLH